MVTRIAYDIFQNITWYILIKLRKILFYCELNVIFINNKIFVYQDIEDASLQSTEETTQVPDDSGRNIQFLIEMLSC